VVITEVGKDGAAVQLGLLPGDVLVSVNKKSVSTKKDVFTLMQNKENSWDLVLKRGNKLLDFQIKGDE
jgi:C-terminal processing protease CtpA/Prc